MQEQSQALDELKATVNAYKNGSQTNGTNDDKLLPKNRDLVSLVMQQNGELRARLSLATGRFSANYVDLLRSMWRRRQPKDTNSQDAVLQEASVATEAVAMQDPNIDADASSRLNFDLSRGLLFSAGDFVRTAYGDGYVGRQRDEDGMCTVNLTWGAVGYMHCTELTLLCVAGEQYFHKDIFTRCFSRKSFKDTALEGMSILDGVHSGSSTRQKLNDENKEQSQASKVARKVRQASVFPEDSDPNDGGSVSVFRSCWRLGAPRGVELKIDPHQSVNTVGYVSGISEPVDEIEKDPIPAVDRNAVGFPVGGSKADSSRGSKSADGDVSANGQVDSEGSALLQGGQEEPHADVEMASPGSPQPSDAQGQVFSRSELGKYKAEVQRLNFQLRTAEESRREQRKRLTESRLTTSQLLSQLQATRSQVAKLQEDVMRREQELADYHDQLEYCKRRYKEAVARAWLREHPEMRTKREDTSSDDDTAESERGQAKQGEYGDANNGYGVEDGFSAGSQQDEDEEAAAAMRGLAWGNDTAAGRQVYSQSSDVQSTSHGGDEEVESAESIAAGTEDAEAVQALAGHLRGGITQANLDDDSSRLGSASRDSASREQVSKYLASCGSFQFTKPKEGQNGKQHADNVHMPLSDLAEFLESNGFSVTPAVLEGALADLGVMIDKTPSLRNYHGEEMHSSEWAFGIAPPDSVIENNFSDFIQDMEKSGFVMVKEDSPEELKDKVFMPLARVNTICSRRLESLPSREAQKRIFNALGITVRPGRKKQFYNGQMIQREGWVHGLSEGVVYSAEQAHEVSQIASKHGIEQVLRVDWQRSAESEPTPRNRRKRGRNSPVETGVSETGSAKSAAESAEYGGSNGEDSDVSENSSKRRRHSGTPSQGSSQSAPESGADNSVRRSRRRSRR